MAENNIQNTENKNTTGQDSLGKAIRRNANGKRIKELISRFNRCLREEGAESAWREVDFRLKLIFKRDVWKYRADIPLKKELKAQRAAQPQNSPKISIALPLYNTPEKFLKECIKSCVKQTYANFQLCIADGSDKENAEKNKKIIESFKDSRIEYIPLEKNEGIAANTNCALAACNGDYITLLDHDDCLYPNALYEVAAAINKTGADMLYSDEIVLDAKLKNLVSYQFKPDYSPYFLRSCNYITHLCVFSKKLFNAVGAYLDSRFDGAQDYDLILRLTEKAEKIHHIPKVLYIWRSHSKSTAAGIENAKPQAIKAGEYALEEYFANEAVSATVTAQPGFAGSYRVKYKISGEPMVSVIIPNKDHTADLKKCLDSLYKNAGYKNMQVIIAENNSTSPETFEFYEKAKNSYTGLTVVKYEGGFNFSAVNNFAVKSAAGEYLLLLNNDIEIISEGFIREMLSICQQKNIGAVGAKLLYPDNTVQHAGVIVGIGGTAGHSHKGHAADNAGDMYRLVTTQNYLAVTGAALMIKKDLYLKHGGLDEENFAVAFNDVDLCLRLYKDGFLNVYTPYAVAYHYESKSRGYDNTGANAERYEKERKAFCDKYADILKNGDPYYNPHFTYKYENFGYK